MKKTIVYLDNCCFNRSYDDQTHEIIYLETEAKLFIQRRIKDRKIYLIWSYILNYENSANPDKDASYAIQLWKQIAIKNIIETENVISNADIIHQKGFGVKDSLHISCAIEAKSDYFITVDKGILNKSGIIKEITILSPIHFIEKEII